MSSETLLSGQARSLHGHNMDTLADRIDWSIDHSEKSQAEIARGIGVERAAVSNWKRGITKATNDNLIALARICGVNPEWLILGRGDRLAIDSPVQGRTLDRKLFVELVHTADSIMRSEKLNVPLAQAVGRLIHLHDMILAMRDADGGSDAPVVAEQIRPFLKALAKK